MKAFESDRLWVKFIYSVERMESHEQKKKKMFCIVVQNGIIMFTPHGWIHTAIICYQYSIEYLLSAAGSCNVLLL